MKTRHARQIRSGFARAKDVFMDVTETAPDQPDVRLAYYSDFQPRSTVERRAYWHSLALSEYDLAVKFYASVIEAELA